MTLDVWCQTDVGLRRESNQDSYLFDQELGLYMVADGMGGHRGGEVASRLAVETVHEVVRKGLTQAGSRKIHPRTLMASAYEEASHRIYDKSQDPASDLHGMGTTLVAALFFDGVLYIANVGDSRAYLFKDKKLWQLTEDHSWINEQLRAGLISETDMARNASKNVITRSVGFEQDVQVDIIERQIQVEEIFLMCSDGLSGLVTDERIAEICLSSKPSEVVSICVNEAKRNGGDDNVTAMIIYARPRPN